MTIHFTIEPGMGNRLKGWQQYIQSTETREDPKGPCITLSREFGCQGYPTAEALQSRLNGRAKDSGNWVVWDRKLLEKIAEDSGYSETELEKARDSEPTMQSMFAMFMGRHQLEQFELFNYMKKAVLHVAEAGNCIIVGRGGACLTQGLPRCVNIRLVAPLEFRIQNIMKTLHLTEEEATEHINAHQQQRDDFISNFTDKDAKDPALYHLVINNAHHRPEEIAALVETYIAQFHKG